MGNLRATSLRCRFPRAPGKLGTPGQLVNSRSTGPPFAALGPKVPSRPQSSRDPRACPGGPESSNHWGVPDPESAVLGPSPPTESGHLPVMSPSHSGGVFGPFPSSAHQEPSPRWFPPGSSAPLATAQGIEALDSPQGSYLEGINSRSQPGPGRTTMSRSPTPPC